MYDESSNHFPYNWQSSEVGNIASMEKGRSNSLQKILKVIQLGLSAVERMASTQLRTKSLSNIISIRYQSLVVGLIPHILNQISNSLILFSRVVEPLYLHFLLWQSHFPIIFQYEMY